MVLDQTDQKLLRILQEDATLSNKELAFKLHKSIAAIHERVKKLKSAGYIKKNSSYTRQASYRYWFDFIFTSLPKSTHTRSLK